MTRINLIAPQMLHKKHLVAEYRELPRIYALVQSAIARGACPADVRTLAPLSYTLGEGHCQFFYTRLGWLTQRYLALIAEMQARGFQTSFSGPPPFAAEIPRTWYGDWTPTPACIRINVERINERLRGMGLADHQIVV